MTVSMRAVRLVIRCHLLSAPSWRERALLVTDRFLAVKNHQMEPLVLHVDGFWNSPYAFSVFVCLKEKGLSFELREVNLHEQAQREPQFRAKSVTGRVPLLEHGDFQLS